MKLLIFSDSHGSTRGMREALRRHADAEVILFLGDGLGDLDRLEVGVGQCVLAVRGNCDLHSSWRGVRVPRLDTLSLCGHRILFTHGDAFSVKYGTDALVAEAVAREADIVLCGHTHVPTERYLTVGERSLWLFNPGTVGYGGRACTYGILTLTEQTVLFSHGTVD